MPRTRPIGRTAAARPPVEPDEAVAEIETADETDQSPQTTQPESQDEASVAFQKQIEALKKSEQIQRDRAEQAQREREDAVKRANEREAEVQRLKKTTFESQAEAVSAALAAAQSDAEAAQRDIERALELGDHKSQAEGYRRLSKAEANIARLEDGKAELDAQAKAAAEAKPQASNDPLDNFDLPPLAKTWLRSHSEYLRNPRLNARLQNLHWDVVDEGHTPYSQEYFDSLETHLGMREAVRTNREQEAEVDEAPQPERRRIVSAPVSREAPPSANGSRPGRITLTVAQREAAKIAGIDEKTYAENLIKLQQEKALGNYGGGGQ